MPHPKPYRDGLSSRSRLREINETAGSRVRRSRSAARRRSPLSGGKPEGAWASNPCSETTRNRAFPPYKIFSVKHRLAG
jgi:hypothetical protein